MRTHDFEKSRRLLESIDTCPIVQAVVDEVMEIEPYLGDDYILIKVSLDHIDALVSAS